MLFESALIPSCEKFISVLLMRDRHCQSASNEVLLRGYSALYDSRAVEVFDDMIQTCCEQVESAITTVVSLSAELRYVQMAEQAAGHIREPNGHAMLALYSALMYSHARLYHKICDVCESNQ